MFGEEEEKKGESQIFREEGRKPHPLFSSNLRECRFEDNAPNFFFENQEGPPSSIDLPPLSSPSSSPSVSSEEPLSSSTKRPISLPLSSSQNSSLDQKEKPKWKRKWIEKDPILVPFLTRNIASVVFRVALMGTRFF